jgi:hypothetical protein
MTDDRWSMIELIAGRFSQKKAGFPPRRKIISPTVGELLLSTLGQRTTVNGQRLQRLTFVRHEDHHRS